MPGYHATALPDRWELRDHSGRLVAAGRADGIADALRWVTALTSVPLAAPIAYMRNAEDSTLHTLHAVREKSRQHPQVATP